MKILLYEVRKLFLSKRSFIIICAFILQIAIMFIPHKYDIEYSDEVYKKYTEQIKGEYTEQKRDFILDRYDEISEIINSYDGIVSAYKRDEISLEEFDNYNFTYHIALAEESTVEHLIEKCNYFDELGRGVFFYDTSWTDFFSTSGYNYIVALTIILLTVPAFTNEYHSNAIAMLLTTRNGRRKVCISKIIIVAIAAFAIAFTIYMLKLAAFMYIKGDNANLGVENLIGYNYLPNISLKQYYLIDTVIKSASWVVASLFICAISVLAKNTVFSLFISFIFVVFPYYIAHLFNGGWFKYVFTANQLGEMYAHDLKLTLLIILYITKSTAYSIFCVRGWEHKD